MYWLPGMFRPMEFSAFDWRRGLVVGGVWSVKNGLTKDVYQEYIRVIVPLSFVRLKRRVIQCLWDIEVMRGVCLRVYMSAPFVVATYSIMCFINFGSPSSLYTFILPAPTSFRSFFLCAVRWRHSSR